MMRLFRGRWPVAPGTAAWLTPAIVAALMLVPWITAVPGLHLDEVWTLKRVADLASGARPLVGMTFYTGALHGYLVWPLVAMLGRGVLALRLLGVITNVAAVAVISRTLGRIYGPSTALATGLLLATSPAFVAFSRFAVELTALSPILLATAFACFSYVHERGRAGWRAWAASFFGGGALGLLAYNHASQLPVVVGIGVALLVASKGRLVLWPVSYVALTGFCAGISPDIVNVALHGTSDWVSGGPGRGAFETDLPYLPDLLARTWDGTLVYFRFAGGPWLPTFPYPLIAAGIVLGLRRARGIGSWLAPASGATGVALACVLITAISPHMTLRYFIAAHLGAWVLLGVLCAPLLADGDGYVRCLMGVVVALNVTYLSVNFFAPYLTCGGGIGTFTIGRRLLETSNHFARTDLLYSALARRGVRRVDTDGFIREPLQEYDVNAHRLSFGLGRMPPSERTALVFWNGSTADGWNPWDGAHDTSRWGDTLDRGGATFVLAEGFPPVFRVYIAGP